MDISREELTRAATELAIPPEQAAALWDRLAAREVPRSRFDLTHVLYYAGALLVIAAMGWLMTLGWESLGGGFIFACALAYAGVFALVGRALWRRPERRVPGGLLATMAVCMTPLAIYGFQRMTGLWPTEDPGVYRGFHQWIKGGWLAMELGTLAAGVLALRFIRFPFITAPMAFALWYMSMDLTPVLFGHGIDTPEHARQYVSMAVGAAMLMGAYAVDRRTREDFAFWGYLFGLMAFWGGLSMLGSGSEIGRLIYCAINVALMGLGVFLTRRVFMVFGTMGVMGYLGHLSWTVFKDSVAFPFVLTVLGLAIMAAGVWYQRNRERLERTAIESMPGWMLKLRPAIRG